MQDKLVIDLKEKNLMLIVEKLSHKQGSTKIRLHGNR